ncbi:DNA ligase D [Cytophagaceae bacterium ABcell3]|nr:DNA ligase D [Cytophagaceae bacterium ABcell3]
MTLKKYAEKRDFTKTPEPSGAKGRSSGGLKFTVQKHHARRLHYDLRLELDGVMVSWAVPKGPSMRPADKRLAMMVEDHPLEYRDFEGIIPKGNYGAGTVMVWDEGSYAVKEVDGRKQTEATVTEATVRQMLEDGNLKVVFYGEKIKGEFALVKSSRGEKGNEWLLIKKRDEFATEEDIREWDYSVKTGRTLDEIAEEAEREGQVWYGGKNELTNSFDDSLKGTMPTNVKPMLATLLDEPFDSDEWLYEIKWDGYRAVAEVVYDKVYLYSRNGKAFNDHFPKIVDALKKMGVKAVFDGEVVAVDEKGSARFDIIQNYKRTQEGNIVYYVFDILYLEGYNLTSLTLSERKKILEKILPDDNGIIRYNGHVEREGKRFFELVEKNELEGIIAKRKAGVYQTGTRSREWLKIKTQRRQEAVIVGITEPKGGRKHFGALLLGLYEGNDLRYIGRVGGGFDERLLKEVYQDLEPLFSDTTPLKNVPKLNQKVQWVVPEKVCEVKFQEWTSEGLLRQPIFLGMREDKPVEDVVMEKEKPVAKVLKTAERKTEEKTQLRPPMARRGKVDLPFKQLFKNGNEGIVEIDGQQQKVTNLQKVYWPDEGYTKGELLEYYFHIAPVILPYLIDRPQSLKRNPNGVNSKGFFQKNMPASTPDWIYTKGIFSEHNQGEINFMFCQNVASLVYMANLGCIEINPWSSRLNSLEYPDYIVIDLDPQDVPFEQVIETALAVKKVLDQGGIQGVCKTSGSRGLHIYIPLGAKYDYDQGKDFAHLLATYVHELVPKFTSLERSPSKRRNKIYLDFLQNRKGQTLAAPYCVRPRPGATVSTPLAWEELKPGLSPAQFTMKNIFSRIKEKGDLFRPILSMENDLAEILARIK